MIRAEFSYTREHFAALVPKQKKGIPFSGVVCVGFIIFIAVLIARGEFPDLMNIIAAVCAFIAFVWELSVRRRNDPDRLYRNYAANNPNCRVTFAFGDDLIMLESISDSGKNDLSAPYSDVTEVRLKDGFFVFTINKLGRSSFRPEEITEGSADELCELLSAKTGGKFRIETEGQEG